MSFTYHPYKVLTIFQANENGEYRWACSSCGAYSKLVFQPQTTVVELHADYEEHVLKSHRIKPEDVKGWALGV